MRSTLLGLLSCILLCTLSSIPLAAQFSTSGGTITGTASDLTGHALAGVQIVASTSDGKSYQTTTDAVGNYRFPNLPEGSYQLTAVLSGFSSQQKNAASSMHGTTTINFDFALAPLETSVTVTAGKHEEILGEMPVTADVLT